VEPESVSHVKSNGSVFRGTAGAWVAVIVLVALIIVATQYGPTLLADLFQQDRTQYLFQNG
jgi:hypothetical protein